MKRYGAILLAIMLALTTIHAGAEQATLIYSFGENALNRVMMESENTVTYNGQTYTFDFGGFSFSNAFPMYGGNTVTVMEFSVPKFRLEMQDASSEMFLGRVLIAPASTMELYVFSGDRSTGQYTLMETRQAPHYAADVYATRDENGTLRKIDRLYLYACQENGQKKYYAASLYIDFENYAAASAEGAQATPVIQPVAPPQSAEQKPAAEPGSLDSILQGMEEEKAQLQAALETKEAELASLRQKNEEQAEQLKELTAAQTTAAAAAELEEKLAAQEATNAELKQQNEALTAQLTGLTAAQTEAQTAMEEAAEQSTAQAAKIAQLTAELTAAQAQAASLPALNGQLVALLAEKAALEQTNKEQAAQIASLTAELTAAQEQQKQLTALEQTNKELAAQTASLTASVTAAQEQQEQLTALEQTNKEQAAQIASLTAELTAAQEQQEQLTALEQTNKEQAAQIASLTAELTAAQSAAQSAASSNNQDAGRQQDAAKIQALTKQVRQLEKQLAQQQAESAHQADRPGQSADQTAAMAALEKENAALKTGAAADKTALEALEKELATAQQSAAADKTAIEALEKELATAQQSAAADKTALETLKKENAALKTGAATDKTTIEALEKELAELATAQQSAGATLNVTECTDEALYELLEQAQQEYWRRDEARKQAAPAAEFLYASNGTEVRINAYEGNEKNVTIPESIDGVPVTRIYDSAFRTATELRSVTLPATLREVGGFAFAYNRKLTGVLDLPASVEKIGHCAFDGTKLKGVIINSSLTTTDNNPFSLPEAEFLLIREGVNPSLGGYAFSNCFSLRIAIIPASVTELPPTAFAGCSRLLIVTPEGSAAEKWANEHFFPVETEGYEDYMAQYEALYPQRW